MTQLSIVIYVKNNINAVTRNEFARVDVLLEIGDNSYSAKVVVGFTDGNEMVVYDIINFVPNKYKLKKTDNDSTDATKCRIRRDTLPVSSTVPQNDTVVNSNIRKNI